jgi:thiamine biosynthesis lipoprotein
MTLSSPAMSQRSDHFRSMGVDGVIVAPPDAAAAVSAARRTLDAWDGRFSRFDPRSELSQLNARAGSRVGTPISEEMASVIAMAISAARATDGLFDPLLGARMLELGYDRTFEELDDSGAVRPSVWVTGRWRTIDLDPVARTVRLPPGTELDFGGLAKGMAVDDALAVVAADAAFAAVSLGGDLAVHGTPPDSREWIIALEGPSKPTVGLGGGGLATSSVLRRRWTSGGIPRHHLLDPRTGLPAETGLAQVTVVAASCTQAEVAAKASLLLGPECGPKFLLDHGLAGILIDVSGAERRVPA